MTFEQLESFAAVVENRTFFDAAEALHTTQSTVSKHIIRLEQELDIKLFDRSRRSAVLTDAGKVFYGDAVKLLAQYKDALARLKAFGSARQEKLVVGTLPILTQYRLTSRLNAFSQEHPDIHLVIEEAEEPELMKGFQEGKYHLIIARKHMVSSGKYRLLPLANDIFCAVFPADKDLADKLCIPEKAESLKDFAGIPFLLMNRYTSVFQLLMERFGEEGIKPRILRTARVESIISAVAVGEGASILPKSSLELFRHESIRILPLNPPINLPVVLAAKEKTLPGEAAETFIGFLERGAE